MFVKVLLPKKAKMGLATAFWEAQCVTFSPFSLANMIIGEYYVEILESYFIENKKISTQSYVLQVYKL